MGSKRRQFVEVGYIKDYFKCSASGGKNGRARSNKVGEMIPIDDGGLSFPDAYTDGSELLDMFELNEHDLNYDGNSASNMGVTNFYAIIFTFITYLILKS